MNMVEEFRKCLNMPVGKKFKMYQMGTDKELGLYVFNNAAYRLNLFQNTSNDSSEIITVWTEVNDETIKKLYNSRFNNEWYFREDGDYQYADDTMRRHKSSYRDDNGNITYETANFEKEVDAEVTALIAKGREKGFTFEEIFYSIVQCTDMQILRMRREERHNK